MYLCVCWCVRVVCHAYVVYPAAYIERHLDYAYTWRLEEDGVDGAVDAAEAVVDDERVDSVVDERDDLELEAAGDQAERVVVQQLVGDDAALAQRLAVVVPRDVGARNRAKSVRQRPVELLLRRQQVENHRRR